ncbi:MAG: hypothetical protein LBE98_04315, partial [Puniceicoccales bacterium]|nr:hypothetical protein [Puniceicoccales bacterium]
MRGFFGNFGGFGRPSWSPLGGSAGGFGNGGMIVGGNMGPFGSGVSHGSLPHMTQPSLTSTLLNTPSVVSHMMTSPVTAIAESFYPKIDLPSITPSCVTAPHVGMSTLPTMELGERFPISVPSMEMKPEVAIAPAPSAPTMTATVEKCGATPPVQEIAGSVPGPVGTTETATLKRSFIEGVKDFLESGCRNLGDFVADENPIILPDGTRDYLAGDHIQQEA